MPMRIEHLPIFGEQPLQLLLDRPVIVCIRIQILRGGQRQIDLGNPKRRVNNRPRGS